MKIETWQHCYDDSWKGLITNDAFAHPAKMARGLVRCIFDELFAMGALRKGEVVIDPFGGVGTTGIEASSRGVQAYLVELEERFVNLAEDNFVLHEKQWALLGKPRPVMLQGDSRKLQQILFGRPEEFVVSSPPYNLPMSQDHNGKRGGLRGVTPSEQGAFVKYGNTEGQLEGMPMGDVAAVISSPPFSPPNCQPVKVRGKSMGVRKDYPEGQRPEDNYGATTGQLGAMPQGSVAAVVSSPPYSSNTVHGNHRINPEMFKDQKRVGKTSQAIGSREMGEYGNTTGQLGAMPAGEVDAVVSSPPYAGDSGKSDSTGHKRAERRALEKGYKQGLGCFKTSESYGKTDGQLGSKDSETFWEAARDIVLECHAVLKPGGVAVWVVKDFVRNKKRVRFSGDWIKLCEACGFKLIRHAHAMLVKETRTYDLFGEETVKRVERKSFFRRLHEQKLPAGDERRIDYEDVVFFQKNIEERS